MLLIHSVLHRIRILDQVSKFWIRIQIQLDLISACLKIFFNFFRFQNWYTIVSRRWSKKNWFRNLTKKSSLSKLNSNFLKGFVRCFALSESGSRWEKKSGSTRYKSVTAILFLIQTTVFNYSYNLFTYCVRMEKWGLYNRLEVSKVFKYFILDPGFRKLWDPDSSLESGSYQKISWSETKWKLWVLWLHTQIAKPRSPFFFNLYVLFGINAKNCLKF